MKTSLKLLVIGALFAVGAAAPLATLAQDKAKVFKDREALMKQQGADLGAVKGYLDDKNDLAKAQAGASNLLVTMKKIPDVFPQGTAGGDPEGKYGAKAEIWTDWNGFLATRDAAAQKAEALNVAVKTGNKEQIQTAFNELGKNGCGGCHGKFREELKK